MNPMQAPNVGPAGADFGNREQKELRAGYQVYKCNCCGDPFEARVADRKRGWARFCSKSCKAIKQEKRTGQYRAYMERQAQW